MTESTVASQTSKGSTALDIPTFLLEEEYLDIEDISLVLQKRRRLTGGELSKAPTTPILVVDQKVQKLPRTLSPVVEEEMLVSLGTSRLGAELSPLVMGPMLGAGKQSSGLVEQPLNTDWVPGGLALWG